MSLGLAAALLALGVTGYWTEETLKVFEPNKNRPFFLYFAHWGIHTPLQAMRADYDAAGDIGPHRLRVYAAMMRALDRSDGRIMQKLEDEGQSDNTVVVFCSDNGSPPRGRAVLSLSWEIIRLSKWPMKTLLLMLSGHICALWS